MARPVEKITVEHLLDALTSIQRRKLLMALLDHNPQDDSPTIIGDNQTEEEEMTHLIDMKHVHLPKLEEYGFITWDQDNNEVTRGPKFEEIRPLLRLLKDNEDALPEDWL